MDQDEAAINLACRTPGSRRIGISYHLVLPPSCSLCLSRSALADKISLQDGRMIEGRLSKLNTMILNPGAAPPAAPARRRL